MNRAIRDLLHSEKFNELRGEATAVNKWFTEDFIDIATSAIEREFLSDEKIERFCTENQVDRSRKNKTLGIICAGNIPLVGFGDMFYGLLSGWDVMIKPSSKDPLMRIFEELSEVTIAEDISQFSSVDAIALMGSDSTCQLIKDQFPNTPLLLRGSMHSIAIIECSTTQSELQKLFYDIFLYCGKGCRNITHLYIEKGVEIEFITSALAAAKEQSSWDFPQCWYDSVRYERAMRAMKGEKFINGEFYLLVEGVSSSIGTLGYQYFSGDRSTIDLSKVQHVAENGNFGEGQFPTLFQFANKESVTEFLSNL